ncbi:MAG: hypothetical protein KGI65_01225 [Acidobacteriota bacterium]|nr:hypothetical protein [Acidobacteriota bacterium]
MSRDLASRRPSEPTTATTTLTTTATTAATTAENTGARVSSPGRPLEVTDLGESAGWSLVAVMILLTGLKVWAGQLELPGALGLSLLLIVVAMLALIVIWSRPNLARVVPVVLLMAAIAGFVAMVVLLVLGNPTYGTDEIAFDQYAAAMAMHGVDPYLHSMAPSLALYDVPDIFRTFLLNGHVVSSLSYPAGSFIAYIPSLLLGMHMQAAVATDSLAWVLAMVLAWRLLPAAISWLAPLLLLSQVLIGYSAGGVTDTLYLPFLVVGLWRWDRYGDVTESSWARWVGPVAVGLACAIKQTPWFVVPFLVVATCYEASRRGQRWWVVGGRYAGIVLGVFALVNAPFIVSAPGAWLRDVVIPLTSPTEPGGQGFVGLTLFARLGGQLHFYTWAGAAALLGALGAFIGWYRHLKRAWVFLVAFVFFWPTRSFGSYLIMLLPAALVAATSVRASGNGELPLARVARWASVGVVAVGVACGVAATSLAPALDLRVLGEVSTGQLQSIDFLHVAVANSSGSEVTPHYAVTPTGQISSFWRVVSGPRVLAPHSSSRVVLEAPNAQSMPSIVGGFIVDAFTASPAQMATTSEVRLNQTGAVLSPEDVNAPQPVGRRIDMRVQLVDRVGDAVHRAGVRVDLGQVVYQQSGLQYGEASINGEAEGQTPVGALTDSSGVADFEVVGVQAQSVPTFFQAWVVRGGRPPQSYSNTVSVQFVATRQHRGR